MVENALGVNLGKKNRRLLSCLDLVSIHELQAYEDNDHTCTYSCMHMSCLNKDIQGQLFNIEADLQ